MVRFPDEEEVRVWIEGLDHELKTYLPLIDEGWYQEMASSFQITALRPDCKEDVCKAGAVLFHKINKNHYRVDGNKRSAVICTYLFFVINGMHLSVLPESLYAIAKGVAENQEKPEDAIEKVFAVFLSSCRAVS